MRWLLSFSLGAKAQHDEKGRGYESVTKIGSSGPSEKVGRERRGRVTRLDDSMSLRI